IEPGKRGTVREVFEAEAGDLVEVGLPPEHPPLPAGAPVYCSSSQAVKQKYRYGKPKPGLHRVRRPLDIELILTAEELLAVGRVPGQPVIERRCTLPGPFGPAKDLTAMATAARSTFEKLGQTRLELRGFRWHNDAGLFTPVSRLNQLRRALTAALEEALEARLQHRIGEVQRVVSGPDTSSAGPRRDFQWSLKVDRISFLDDFEDADFADLDEIIVDIARDHPTMLPERLEALAARLGRARLRLALPALTRRWEDNGLRHKIDSLLATGWGRWQAANLSAW